MLYQTNERLFWSLLHDSGVRDLAVAAPASIVNEVSAENHTHEIKLKSLGRIYALYLIDPVRVGGAEIRLRDAGRRLPASAVCMTDVASLFRERPSDLFSPFVDLVYRGTRRRGLARSQNKSTNDSQYASGDSVAS